MEEVERLKSDHGAALAELKATLLPTPKADRTSRLTLSDLAEAHSSRISELESKHTLTVSGAGERFENERAALVDAHSKELENLTGKHQLALANTDDQRPLERDTLTKSHEAAIAQLLSTRSLRLRVRDRL